MTINEKIESNEELWVGSDWEVEHEDFLIGNKEGLEKLPVVVSQALKEGERDVLKTSISKEKRLAGLKWF